ncbi:MAG: M48 family metalloprotease [Dongiaceae bacterium]
MIRNTWRSLYLVLLAAVAVAESGCSTNPATGESSFTGLMSESEEQSIGRENHPKILQEFGGAYPDRQVQDYISSLGNLQARASDRPNQRFTFTVLDTPIVNAFAVPGGYIYVTRGLLALANNEAEVAGVLAHEIGHIAARHSAERYSKGVLLSIPAVLLGVVTGSQEVANLAGSAGAVYLQSYSRDQEYQADLLGVRYLSRTSYDPYGMATFLAQLEADDKLDSKLAGNPELADQNNIMASHPRTADRIQRAIQEAGGSQVSNPIVERELYLRKIDGLLYGDQPEEGFIRGRRFAHPTLRFEFEVPAGFHMRNTSSAVVAVRADGGQIVFDREAERFNGGMLNYMVDQWAPRLDLRDAEWIDVNGLEGATGTARVNTRSGTRDIRLVAIRARNNAIYRFLFISKPELTSQLAAGFRQTTYSFRELSAGEAAQLRPQHIEVIQVRSGDTVDSLANRMAFDDYRVERFLVLNGLKRGDRLRAGQLVKIIAE